MSVLQTVQKKQQQAIYIWTDSAKNNNKQFTYGQTVQKKQQAIYIWTDSAKNNKQFTYGQTVQKKQQAIYIWTDSAKKLHWSIYSAPDSAKKTINNLHMDSTYLQTVQKTMCKIHIHILSTQCTIKTHSIISDTLYTVWAHLHYVQYLYQKSIPVSACSLA